MSDSLDQLLDGLTEPQRQAVMHVDGPLLVLAGPGSGKTTVVTRRVAHLIAQGIPAWQILALTFTNKAAGEMRQRVNDLVPEDLPGRRGLTIATFHSFCARLLRRYADAAGVAERFSIYDAADQRQAIRQALKAAELNERNFTPAAVGAAISNAKNRLQDAAAFASQAGDFYARSIARAYTAYEKILHSNDALDFDDLLLVTARLLRRDEAVRCELQERYQYLLIDEYQDTNHAQFLIAASLAAEHRNICVVGDPDQCLPPGTPIMTPRGAVPIEALSEGDEVITAAGWGDTMPRPVEKVMTRSHRGPLVVLTVEGGLELRATPNHIVFSRIRPDPSLHFTYLMWRRGIGWRIGRTRGVRASKDGVVLSGLQVRTNQEVADAIWILHAAGSVSEAMFHEHYYSVRYGIPTMVFFVRGRRMEMTQDWVDRLYAEIDTENAAARLMTDLHLDRRFPHHRPGAVVRGDLARRYVLFTVFGDGRRFTLRPWHEHRVQFVTSGDELRRRASARFRVRDGRKGTWRIETSRKDYDDAQGLADAIRTLDDDIELLPRARLTEGKPFPFMPISHVHPGMVVPVLIDDRVEERLVESVRREDYDGPVYDLSVPNTRNYSAGGVIVHNSIYGWRGADIRNILEFEQHYPDAQVIALGQNFRSTGHIVAAADGLIRHNMHRKHKPLHTELEDGEKPTIIVCRDEQHEAQLLIDAFRHRHDEHDIAWKGMAVLYRINALSRVLEEAFRDTQIPYIVARGTAFYDRKEIKDALSYLRLIANPSDEVALRRIINTPPRGIGKVTLDKIELFALNNQMRFFDALRAAEQVPGLSARAVGAVSKFVSMIESWRIQALGDERDFLGAAPAAALADLVERIVRESAMEALYKQSKSEEDLDRLENLEELISAAAQFEPAVDESDAAARDAEPRAWTLMERLDAYLESVALVSDADAIDPASGAVTLMTLHAAKGLEFDVVAVAGLEDGLLPHMRANQDEMQMEEERRLCFVGMTRAKRHLLLTRAAHRTHRGLRERTIPSPFLSELPAGLIVHSDQAFDAADFDPYEDEFDMDRSSAPARGAVLRAAFPKGCLVRHPTFGIGRVESITPRPAGSSARVRFQSVGMKTLILEYAKLERVE